MSRSPYHTPVRAVSATLALALTASVAVEGISQAIVITTVTVVLHCISKKNRTATINII